MTREEAISIMKVIVHMLEEQYDTDRVEDAVEMAIKALEQEPCEDAISRQAVEETIFAEGSYEKLDIDFAKIWLLLRAIKALPSVTPYPKTKQEMTKSVMLLDLFTKTYCRYQNDYERFGDLKFRCDECPFQKENGACLVKSFKNKYAPDYKDFGSMGDL